MSLRELEEAIKNSPVPQLSLAKNLTSWEIWGEEIKKEFVAFKKQLEEALKFATLYKLPSDYSEKAKFILKLLEESK